MNDHDHIDAGHGQFSPRGRSITRRARAGGALLACAVVIASCSSSEDSTSSTTAAPTTSAAPSTTEAPATSSTETTVVENTSTTSDNTSTTAANNAQDATPAIVAAATTFLGTLTEAEKEAVSFEFTDTEQRQRWSNLPQGLYDRAGVRWGDLDEDSQQAWLNVLKAILSEEGYTQVIGEWGADDHLQGGDYGKDNYWVAVIGTPSETEPWQFQFGGHHITVNATIKGSDISITPSFIGVQPAMFDDNGKEIRPLGSIEDDAFALVGSLDDAQKSKAVLGGTLIDLVAGPGQDGKTVENQGIVGADLTDDQKTMLLSLIGHYGNLVNAEDGAVRMAQLEADIDSTYFVWYGPTDQSDTSGIYFRVTGPHIVIEYSGQQMGGNASDHIHGIYRDPTNDYGEAFGAGLG